MNIKELIEKHGNSNENWLILEFLTGKKSVELKMELTFCVDSIYNEFLETKLSITIYIWKMEILWFGVVC